MRGRPATRVIVVRGSTKKSDEIECRMANSRKSGEEKSVVDAVIVGRYMFKSMCKKRRVQVCVVKCGLKSFGRSVRGTTEPERYRSPRVMVSGQCRLVVVVVSSRFGGKSIGLLCIII